MSIPAVLYDHIPVDDLQDDGDAQNEIEGLSFYVSSMVHRTSAPPEGGDGVGNGDQNSNQFEQSRFIENRKVSNESNDGVGTNEDGESENYHDTEIVENVEIDDRPMETIIESIDFDYVLIPIPSPTISGDDDIVLPIVSRTTTGKIRNRIRTCGRTLLMAAKSSSESNRHRITNLWKANDTVAKCLSGCASGSRAILKPFQFYARDLVSSSIYSSYDWVSETTIDGSGNRLILPGSCISLDSDDSRNSITDGRRKHPGETDDAGMLIVPADSDGVGLKRGAESTSRFHVIPSSSPSSLWTSNTIMVSAHDLLAVKHDQHIQLGDRNDPRPLSVFESIKEEEKRKTDHSHYYYRDGSTITVATTHNVAQQWTYAFWKLAQRKAEMWYYISRSCLRRSIQSFGCPFISLQQYLIQYCKSNNGLTYHSLVISTNYDFANSEDHSHNIDYDENRGDEQETSRSTVARIPAQVLSNRSLSGKKMRDKIINECDVKGRSSECRFVIEMTTLILNSRNG